MSSMESMTGWVTSVSPLTVSFTEGDSVQVSRCAAPVRRDRQVLLARSARSVFKDRSALPARLVRPDRPVLPVHRVIPARQAPKARRELPARRAAQARPVRPVL
jgi:hypothetical protein